MNYCTCTCMQVYSSYKMYNSKMYNSIVLYTCITVYTVCKCTPVKCSLHTACGITTAIHLRC